MSSFFGTWIRYKAENEKAAMEHIGYGQVYDMMKDIVPEMVISHNKEGGEDSHSEVYKRGNFNREYIINVGGKSVFNMEDGTVDVFPKFIEGSKKNSVLIEFDYKGTHHKYTRTVDGNELKDVCDYDNGKCISAYYYKR